MAALYECDLHGCSKTVPEAEAVRAGWVSVIDVDLNGIYCTRAHAAQALGGVKAYTEERLAQLTQEATDAGYKVGAADVGEQVADVLVRMGLVRLITEDK